MFGITHVISSEKDECIVEKMPPISEAEFEVMKVVWEYAPVNTNEVIERLTKKTDWKTKTIQTLLARLVKKGALSFTKDGRVFVYTPAVEKSNYLKTQGRSFLNRFYEGDLNSLVLSMIEAGDQTAEELNALYEIIHARKTGKKD